jgi:16S rRNA (adenine1518-N6/adenine1519-N6)-dimethyltransferase
MDIDQLKKLLRSFNLKPNFTYGQNFLIDDFVLQDIVDAAEVSYGDVILEIGPGIGNLTRLLCERALHQSPHGGSGTGQAGFVLSVEKDPKFFPILKNVKKDYPENFRFEIADALEFDFQKTLNDRRITAAAEQDAEKTAQRSFSVPKSASYKVVANIPYFITGKILKMLMTAKNKPTSITILTQKEVARNISAKAGDLSILAISVQLFGEPKIIQTVLAKSFYPAPKVDSAIVKIDLFKKPKYILADEKKFFKIIKGCFSGKRKQIHNTLVNNLGLEKNSVLEILSSLKIKPEARPQELGIQKWIELTNKIFN